MCDICGRPSLKHDGPKPNRQVLKKQERLQPMKMSNGEKMIFAAHFSYMLKNGRSCTVEDCISDATSAVILFRRADMNRKGEEARNMWRAMKSDNREEDC